MIPQFYQDHLQSQFSPAEYLLVRFIIQILQAIKTLSLEKIATALPLPVLFASRRKKIQRLLMLPQLIGLLVLMTLAYSMTTIEGKILKNMGIQKYIGRVKKEGRWPPVGRWPSERRHSSFYIGLYSHSWVNFYGDFQNCIVSLIQLNPNKRPYYRKGIRAMELAIAAL